MKQNFIPPPVLWCGIFIFTTSIIFFLLLHVKQKRRKKMKNNLNDRLDMLVKLEKVIVDEVSLFNVGDFEGCDEDEY